MPEHVETMLAVLEGCDLANALPLYVDRQEGLKWRTVDLEKEYFRHLLLSGANRVPLSCCAHTLRMYRKLPHGWRTTPAGIPTDLYMWQQFLSDPDCRAKSAFRATVLGFPAVTRKNMNAAERARELAEWGARIQTCADLTLLALEPCAREGARLEADVARSVELRAGTNLTLMPLIGSLVRFAYGLRDRVSSR
jgi:hypothetical protein